VTEELKKMKEEIKTELKKELKKEIKKENRKMFKKFLCNMLNCAKKPKRNDKGLEVIESQKEEITSLKGELDKKEKMIESLNKENFEIKSRIEAIKRECEEKDKQLALLSQTPFVKLQNLYKSLNPQTKTQLQNTLKGEDVELFASAVLNLDSIWEVASHLFRENNYEEAKKVKEIFELVFDDAKDVLKLTYQEVNKFDEELHTRDNQSPISGEIKEVLLRGYLKKGKLQKKSIVRLG
jgi:hypothetical protein